MVLTAGAQGVWVRRTIQTWSQMEIAQQYNWNGSKRQFEPVYSTCSMLYSKWMNCIHQPMSAHCLGAQPFCTPPPPPPLSLALTSQLQLCCVATSTFKKTGLTTWGSDFSTVWPKQFVPQWLSDPNFTQGTTKMLSHQNNKCTCYTITGGLQFRVVVEDNAVVNPKSATATVTVSITRDTSPPRFIQDPYSTTINYDEQVGSSVYLLSATDPDLIVSWLEFSVGVAVSLHSLFAGEYIYITICSLHQGQWEEFLEFGGMLKFEELVPFTP